MSADKDELLRRALIEARKKEFENIPCEDELEKQHVFTASFLGSMKKLERKNRFRKNYRRLAGAAAGFILVFLIAGGAFMLMGRGMVNKDSAVGDGGTKGQLKDCMKDKNGHKREELAAADTDDAASYYEEDIESDYIPYYYMEHEKFVVEFEPADDNAGRINKACIDNIDGCLYETYYYDTRVKFVIDVSAFEEETTLYFEIVSETYNSRLVYDIGEEYGLFYLVE